MIAGLPAGFRGKVTSSGSLTRERDFSLTSRLGSGIKEDAVSVYRVIDVIGTSTQSWEDAAVTAVNTARKSLRELAGRRGGGAGPAHRGKQRHHRLPEQAAVVLQVRGPRVSTTICPCPGRHKVKIFEPNGPCFTPDVAAGRGGACRGRSGRRARCSASACTCTRSRVSGHPRAPPGRPVSWPSAAAGAAASLLDKGPRQAIL